MRVISGQAKGMKLLFPKGSKIRPAMDRVREDIFNIIGPDIVDSNVLDVFAGTGSIGIEALSRGALSVRFVETDSFVAGYLHKNLELTGLRDRSKIFKGDFRKALANFGAMKSVFDYIFIDPPYHHGFLEESLKLVTQKSLLATDGWIIIENHKVDKLSLEGLPLEQFRMKKYGQTHLLFLRKTGDK